MAWLKLHTDIIDDPKMMSLTMCQFRQFILMLCFAAEINDSGKFRNHDHKAIAWRLRERAGDIRKLIDKLIEVKIMTNKNGYLEFINWQKRQYSESYKRVTKHREKKRLSNAYSNDSETPYTDTDTDTDKDKKTTYVETEKIAFDWSSGEFQNLDRSLIENVWKNAYPAVDVPQEIKKAAAWLLANPANRKKNYQRFLTNWLSRTQEKAPRVSNGSGAPDDSRLESIYHDIEAYRRDKAAGIPRIKLSPELRRKYPGE